MQQWQWTKYALNEVDESVIAKENSCLEAHAAGFPLYVDFKGRQTLSMEFEVRLAIYLGYRLRLERSQGCL